MEFIKFAVLFVIVVTGMFFFIAYHAKLPF